MLSIALKEMNHDERQRERVSEKKPLKEGRAAPSGILLGPAKQIQVTLPADLSIIISRQAFGQLFGYADATQLEVSLLGIVDRDGSTFTVREFFLVPQKGATSHTETDPATIGELIERLMSESRADDARKIRCWAHSHPGMDVFWSRTDDVRLRRSGPGETARCPRRWRRRARARGAHARR